MSESDAHPSPPAGSVSGAGSHSGPESGVAHSLQQATAGDLAGAEQTIRDVLNRHPNHWAARLHLARVLLARNLAAEAVFELEKCLTGPAPAWADELQMTLLAADAALRAGQLAKAESWGRRVLALAPGTAQAMFLVGMVCQQTQRLTEALQMWQSGLRLEPNALHGWVNKGLIEKQQGQLQEAIASFRQALALNPAIPPVYYSLGLTHVLRGERAEAEQAFRRCLELNPAHAEAAMQLATLLRYENRPDDAAEIYGNVLRNDPGNAAARFYLDSLTQNAEPARIPANVIRAIYADESVGRSLEGSLVKHLQYRTPGILQSALEDALGAERPALDILDLGCGSGIYGSLLKPRAKRMTAVDLSAAMIEECRRKGVYDELHVQDIADYLREVENKFDLIVAMDMLCFFSDLHELVARCAAVLKPGGLFAFSVERATNDQPWQFHHYGHFLHSLAHLHEVASAAGLREARIVESVLRRELDEDRPGYVALLVRAD